MLKLIATITEDDTTESIYIKRNATTGAYSVLARSGLSYHANLVKTCGSYTAAVNTVIDRFGDFDNLQWVE